MPSSHFPSRRTVLRGAGVTVALPWLEAFPLVACGSEKATEPKRFAALQDARAASVFAARG